MPDATTRCVYEACGIELALESASWSIYRPRYNASMEADLESLAGAEGKWVEAISGSDTLVHRPSLWNYVLAYVGPHGIAGIMPETFDLSLDADLERLAHAGSDDVFILKGTSHGRRGLRLVNGPDQVRRYRAEFLIAQRFIFDQLRYRDTTFHLRCFMLLTRTEGIQTTYLFEDAVCLYAVPAGQAKDLFEEWVTHRDNVPQGNDPCSLYEMCESLGLSYETLWWQIAARVIAIISATSGKLGQCENLRQSFCYQLFGVDVILKADGTPLVCEINKGPQMGSKHPGQARIKKQMLRDALGIAGIIDQEDCGFVQILSIAHEARKG